MIDKIEPAEEAKHESTREIKLQRLRERLLEHQESELLILQRNNADRPLRLHRKQEKKRIEGERRSQHTHQVMRHAQLLSKQKPIKLIRPKKPMVRERPSMNPTNAATMRGSRLLQLSTKEYTVSSDLSKLHSFDEVEPLGTISYAQSLTARENSASRRVKAKAKAKGPLVPSYHQSMTARPYTSPSPASPQAHDQWINETV